VTGDHGTVREEAVLRDLYLWGWDDDTGSIFLSRLRIERQKVGWEGNVIAGSGSRHLACGCEWLAFDFRWVEDVVYCRLMREVKSSKVFICRLRNKVFEVTKVLHVPD
jgi:hypothetical protein